MRFIVIGNFDRKLEKEGIPPLRWNIYKLKNQSEWPNPEDITLDTNTILFFFSESKNEEELLKQLIVFKIRSDSMVFPINIKNLIKGCLYLVGKKITDSDGQSYIFNESMYSFIPISDKNKYIKYIEQ